MKRQSYILFLILFVSLFAHLKAGAQKGNPSPDLFREKLFVHTDKESYLAGEIIWFKAYCADAYSSMPLNISKVAYVELLSRDNEPVLQAKIALNEDGGSGSFYLPLTVKSDRYVLRAYTSWMKNAGTAFFFEKTVSVVNTMRAERAAVMATPAPASWEIAFFPEGGYLVEGVESKMGYKITGEDGMGLQARGVITDNDGNEVLSFSPARFGIGHFKFKAEAGKTYTATITDGAGKTGNTALPPAQPYGYVLSVADNKDGRVKATIATRMQQGGGQVLLAAHYGGRVHHSGSYNPTPGNDLVVYMEKEKLGRGVNYFTLFDREGKPLAERLYFNPSGNSSVVVNITPENAAYQTKEEVKLTLNSTGDADTLNCSVSIYKAEPWQQADPDNIVSYLSLTSALKGTIESPGYYFSGDAGVAEAMDNLMLTHGWRRFAQAQAKTAITSLPEYKGHFITGRVVNVTTGNPVAGADCFLSVPSSPFGCYMATSDSTGLVRFEVKDYYGPGEIIVQPDVANAGNYRVDVLNPFSDEKAYTVLPAFRLDSIHAAALLEHSIAMQSQNIYFPDSIRKFELPSLIDTLPFFGKSEFNYPLDDYKRFTTMEEVLREYVTPVNVAMRSGKLYMSIYNELTRQVQNTNMLVMLDGVPLPDPNKIFSYDPLKVKLLRVVPRAYVLNSKMFSGVVSFETYKGHFDGFELAPSLVAIDYEGLQMQREFYIPKYEPGKENRIPDMRTTLLWKPDLKVQAGQAQSVSFPASERKGTFLVVLQGLSKKGERLYSTATFEVK